MLLQALVSAEGNEGLEVCRMLGFIHWLIYDLEFLSIPDVFF